MGWDLEEQPPLPHLFTIFRQDIAEGSGRFFEYTTNLGLFITPSRRHLRRMLPPGGLDEVIALEETLANDIASRFSVPLDSVFPLYSILVQCGTWFRSKHPVAYSDTSSVDEAYGAMRELVAQTAEEWRQPNVVILNLKQKVTQHGPGLFVQPDTIRAYGASVTRGRPLDITEPGDGARWATERTQEEPEFLEQLEEQISLFRYYAASGNTDAALKLQRTISKQCEKQNPDLAYNIGQALFSHLAGDPQYARFVIEAQLDQYRR